MRSGKLPEGTTITEPGAATDAGDRLIEWVQSRTEPELLASRRREAWADWLTDYPDREDW